MSYKLQTPYNSKQRADFIVEYNHRRGLRIESLGEDLYALEENEIIVNNEVIIDPDYKTKKEQEERERLDGLMMTRSDFFDGTIKAFGADSDDLLKPIEYVLSGLEIDSTDKKVALNNYKNAQNFYRKHPLFTMLSGVEIPIGKDAIITISSEQWDRFFDETDKKNPEAYKELLPAEKIKGD